MVSTTPEAFREFKRRLLLTGPQRELVRSRKMTASGYLDTAFPASSDLALRATHLIGSAGRDTIIRPLDDVDVFAIFLNKDRIFERLYRNDSRRFLYRVRDALSAYRVEVVGARGQAVRLFYSQRPHVDIAPVFKWSTGGFALPDGHGSWLTTDPFVHHQWIEGRDKALGYRLKPLIRMLKRWNNEHSKHLKGFHLEVVAGTVFKSIGPDSRDACERFFEWSQNRLRVDDPAGYGGDLSVYLTDAKRALVLTALEAARSRASMANAAERRGDHSEAIRQWRMVFGDEFPAFG